MKRENRRETWCVAHNREPEGLESLRRLEFLPSVNRRARGNEKRRVSPDR